MRNIWTSINIGCYLIDGCEKLLPKDIREKFDHKRVEVRYTTYPLKVKGTYCWEYRTGYVNSPKTYGDLLKPYKKWLVSVADDVDNDRSDRYYCVNEVFSCYLDGIMVDCDDKVAIIDIGS